MATSDTDALMARLTATSAELVKTCDAVEPELFHDSRDAAATTRYVAGGFGVDGQYRFAPEASKVEALDRFRAEVDHEIGVKLGEAEETVELLNRLLPPIEAQLAEPLDAVKAYEAAWPLTGVDPGRQLQVQILDELRQARLVPQLQAMSGVQVLAAYEAAVREPLNGESACLIRLVESFRAANRLAPAKTPEDARALAALSKKVAEVRESRLPEPLKAWRETVKRVRKTMRLADAGSIKVVRPSR